jgi:predicted phosphodiesterase
MESAHLHFLGEGGIVRLGGKRIALTHGHETAEIRRLLAEEPDYLFLGHSHRRIDRREGRTRVINPGALHRAVPWTFGLLDLELDLFESLELER